MKRLITLFALLPSLLSLSQDAAREWTVQLSATVNDTPAEITLNWLPNTNATPNTYLIWRKVAGETSWGSPIATLSDSDLSYTDNTVEVGVSYEYRVEFRLSSTIYAWGYINSGIDVELDPNKGDLLLVVDSTFVTSLSAEIQALADDLYRDGWMVSTIEVDPAASPQYVKDQIVAQYGALPNLTAVYLLGHIPVPYSGNLYPDAHPDHEGAWPADVYYADMDGDWTDATVNNTVATSTRNDNVPGDGKFDQSTVPSELELQIGRIDFDDLPVYTETHQELLQNYLAKAHEFKVADYVPQDRGLVDQGGFTGMAEGFAQNGFRNFTAFFGDANVDHIDYWTNLSTDDYLWSYGCGAGSYTSAGALDGGSSLTSAEIAAGTNNSTFTMLFGSYFGDWDTQNNLMRTAVANGKVLSCSWAGRPNWHYHHMAMGQNIGYSALISETKWSGYLSLTLGGGFVTGEGVHVALMGDPSLRMYYLQPPSDLSVTNVDNVAELTWTASADATVEGYNVYRRPASGIWEKVNTSLVTGTTYSDPTIPTGEEYIFMVKSVKKKTNASGSFYNESLGTVDSDFFSVSIDENTDYDVRMYPNPSNGIVQFHSAELIDQISILNSRGQQVYQQIEPSNTIDLNQLPNGVYFVKLFIGNEEITKKLVVQK